MHVKRGSRFAFVALLAVCGFLFGAIGAVAEEPNKTETPPPVDAGDVRSAPSLSAFLQSIGAYCESNCCWASGCNVECSSSSCFASCPDGSSAKYTCDTPANIPPA